MQAASFKQNCKLQPSNPFLQMIFMFNLFLKEGASRSQYYSFNSFFFAEKKEEEKKTTDKSPKSCLVNPLA